MRRESAAKCLFTSDLHGRTGRYALLLGAIEKEQPDAVFIGGDLLSPITAGDRFLEEHLFAGLRRLRRGAGRPFRFFVILGNDDPRAFEETLVGAEENGLLEYVHDRTVPFGGLFVTGYSCVPPTPFPSKDWEKYDVSRHVDPGCVSPEEGYRSVPVDPRRARFETIAADLNGLVGNAPPDRTIFLFHAPPYGSSLDRAALDGRMVDHAPVDVHVGSVAMARFIEERQPLATLHGHVHEAPRLTGRWRERIGRTWAFSGCHDGPGLALVRFDAGDPGAATREILGE
ncbi:MAG: metallophosphoesterase [Candidatus Eisenbacteria bacterium]|nr:metallophosphoesterase [Candidatus Eisenbacteria bacterium]